MNSNNNFKYFEEMEEMEMDDSFDYADLNNDDSFDYIDFNNGAPPSPELLYRRIQPTLHNNLQPLQSHQEDFAHLNAKSDNDHHFVQLTKAEACVASLSSYQEEEQLCVVNPFFHSHANVETVKLTLEKALHALDFDWYVEDENCVNVVGIAIGEEVLFSIALYQDVYNGASVIRIDFQLKSTEKKEYQFLELFDEVRSLCSAIDDVEIITRGESTADFDDEFIDEEFLDDLLYDITSCEYYYSREEAAKTLAQLCLHQSIRNLFIDQRFQSLFIGALSSMIHDKEPIQRFALFCLSKIMEHDSLCTKLIQTDIFQKVGVLQQQRERTSTVKLAQKIHLVY